MGVIFVLIMLVVGVVVGEVLGIEEGLNWLGDSFKWCFWGGGFFIEGFVVVSLLFCIGLMMVIGGL